MLINAAHRPRTPIDWFMGVCACVWRGIMPKYNEKKLSLTRQNELMDEFCEMLSKLGVKEKIYNFLKDLLNRKERMMIIRRLQIAKMLKQGRKYYEIKEALGCGCSTIARVQKWLYFGRGGYQAAIDLLK